MAHAGPSKGTPRHTNVEGERRGTQEEGVRRATQDTTSTSHKHRRSTHSQEGQAIDHTGRQQATKDRRHHRDAKHTDPSKGELEMDKHQERKAWEMTLKGARHSPGQGWAGKSCAHKPHTPPCSGGTQGNKPHIRHGTGAVRRHTSPAQPRSPDKRGTHPAQEEQRLRSTRHTPARPGKSTQCPPPKKTRSQGRHAAVTEEQGPGRNRAPKEQGTKARNGQKTPSMESRKKLTQTTAEKRKAEGHILQVP